MIYDINCYYGHFPFRRLRHESLSELYATHAANGIVGGAVSHLTSIFYADPSEGDDEMVAENLPYGYLPTPTVDPCLPCVTTDLDRYAPRAVRIFPTICGVDFASPVMNDLAAELVSRDIRLIVTARLYVSREAHLLVLPEPNVADILDFAARHPSLKLALCSFETSEIVGPGKIAEATRAFGNVVFDMSFVRGTRIERIVDAAGVDALVYGSSHPMLCTDSSRLTVEGADISNGEKARIFAKNYVEFMK